MTKFDLRIRDNSEKDLLCGNNFIKNTNYLSTSLTQYMPLPIKTTKYYLSFNIQEIYIALP